MPKISATMDVSKATIEQALKGKPDLQKELKRDGAEVYFLNPSKFFHIKETNKRLASSMRSMLNNVVWKMVQDDADGQETMIIMQVDDFERGEGCFSKPMAIKYRD